MSKYNAAKEFINSKQVHVHIDDPVLESDYDQKTFSRYKDRGFIVEVKAKKPIKNKAAKPGKNK